MSLGSCAACVSNRLPGNELHVPDELRAFSLRHGSEQCLPLLHDAENDLQQHRFAGRRQSDCCGPGVCAVSGLGDELFQRHPRDHLAQGAAINANTFREIGQRHCTPLVKREEHTELPGRYFALASEFLVKILDAGFDDPSEKSNTFVKIEGVGAFFGLA